MAKGIKIKKKEILVENLAKEMKWYFTDEVL